MDGNSQSIDFLPGVCWIFLSALWRLGFCLSKRWGISIQKSGYKIKSIMIKRSPSHYLQTDCNEKLH
ncbi:hypothetical protein ACHQM5_024508 [Ranunculus cassubicifolius]